MTVRELRDKLNGLMCNSDNAALPVVFETERGTRPVLQVIKRPDLCAGYCNVVEISIDPKREVQQ